MTSSENLLAHSSPQPGDVIFVYSGGKGAVISGLLQRELLNPSEGPWFTHVAVALSDRTAIEATSNAGLGQTNWSGVVQGEGVGLKLLPDLVIPSKKFAVMRHPRTAEVAKQFELQAPQIGFVLGSGYSIELLVAKVRESHPNLVAPIPEKLTQWSAEPDQIAKWLREDPILRAGLERHLETDEVLASLDDYYCSQLASYLLVKSGLLKSSPDLETPCTLFDRLVASEWQDVTEAAYGAHTIEGWRGISADDWQIQYQLDSSFANYFRKAAHSDRLIESCKELLGDFEERLGRAARVIRDLQLARMNLPH